MMCASSSESGFLLMQAMPSNPPNAFPLFTLLRYRFISIKNTLKNAHKESRLKIVVVTIAGIIFWLGLFWAFMDSIHFVFLKTGPQMGTKLVHLGLSIFFMALMVMLIFSNALISFTNLFKSNETAHLYSMPLRRETIFLYKLFESLLYSSWAVFALGCPLMLALGIQTHADWRFYPLSALMSLPFVLFPAGVGALIGLLLTALVPRYKKKILALAAAAVACAAVYVGYQLYDPHLGLSSRGMDQLFTAVMSKVQFARHYMTPNYWMAEGLLRVGEGSTDGIRICGIFAAAILSSALLAVALGWFLAGSMYASAYSAAHGMGNAARRAGPSLIERVFKPFAMRQPQVAALMIKDVKTFFRDPAQWAQVLIFFGILLIYNTNIQGLTYPIDQPLYKNMTQFLNLGAASMTLATICSRFIFPMISLEGQRFWILGLAPISRRQIIWSKFYFAFGGTALISVPLATVSNLAQHSEPLVLGVQVWMALLIAFGLSGLTVGMGALFPNFKEHNPSKIVSGFGGTLTLVLAIGLVATSVGGGGLLFHRFMVLPQVDTLAWHPKNDAVWALPFVGFVTVLNLAAGLIPMKLGARALEWVEF